ncbi:MAG: tetratricopeptide repeat protein [Planctomycetes bacterium]|nr:tetratricopeptide repeat protein [Planctomycetota bacterium]
MTRASARLLVLFALLAVPLGLRAEDEGENLVLRAKGGRVVSVSSDRGSGEGTADRLIDGKTTDEGYSTAEGTKLPQDVVLAFNRDQVAALRSIRLDPSSVSAADCRAKDFEVLVSLASPIDDFVSLGRWKLANEPKSQSFDLPHVPAKFVRVRLLSNHGGRTTTLNEIQLWGVVSREPEFFVSQQDPAKLDKFRKLRAESLVPVVRTPLEQKLFAAAATGKLASLGLAEAALIASGCADEESLGKYAAVFQKLVEQARAGVSLAGKKDLDKGRLVFEWLHKNFFTHYRSRWTDLTGVLDTREFNCVSSATLYNAVGEAFGLDLRAIEVPDHAFSLLYADGQVVDVETTTPLGFNPLRDQKALEQFKEQTGFVYIEDPNSRQRREVGDVGLVAIVYYNRGVGFLEEGRFPDAVAANVKALELDPGSSSALRNLLAAYNTWGLHELEARDFDKAARVFQEGLRIDPFHAALSTNRIVAYQQWGVERVKAKDWSGAVAAFVRGMEADPDNLYFQEVGRDVYESWAMDLAAAGDAPGMDQVLSEGAEKLRLPALAKEGKASALRRLGCAELQAKNFDKALSWLSEARRLAPEDARVQSWWQGAYYDWAQSLWDQGKPREAIDVYQAGLKIDPAVSLFRHNRAYFVQEWMARLAGEGKEEELVATLQEVLAVDPEDKDFQQLRVSSFLNWGYREAKSGHFQRALEIYDRGLRLSEGEPSANVLRNRAATLQQWAERLVEEGKPELAECLLVQSTEAYPKDPLSREVRNGWLLNHGLALHKGGDSEAAIALYNRALRIDPGERRFVGNRKAIYFEWTKALADKGDRAAAAGVWERAVKDDPADADFKRALEEARGK